MRNEMNKLSIRVKVKGEEMDKNRNRIMAKRGGTRRKGTKQTGRH